MAAARAVLTPAIAPAPARRHTAHLLRAMTRGETSRPLPALSFSTLGGVEDGLESAAVHDYEDPWQSEEQQATVQAELELCLTT